jgi:hypothetical protein
VQPVKLAFYLSTVLTLNNTNFVTANSLHRALPNPTVGCLSSNASPNTAMGMNSVLLYC